MHVTEKKKRYRAHLRTKVLNGQFNLASGDWTSSKGATNKSDKQLDFATDGVKGGARYRVK